jgi:hypothetical protein
MITVIPEARHFPLIAQQTGFLAEPGILLLGVRGRPGHQIIVLMLLTPPVETRKANAEIR